MNLDMSTNFSTPAALDDLLCQTNRVMESFDWERFANWFTPQRVTADASRRAEFQQLVQRFHEIRRRLTVLNAVDSQLARKLWMHHAPECLGAPVFLLPQAQADEHRYIAWMLGRVRKCDRQLETYRRLRSGIAVRFDENDREAALNSPASTDGAAAQVDEISDLLFLLDAKEPGHGASTAAAQSNYAVN